MNVNKLILEISYLFCCIGPIVILIIRNINDLMTVTFGILSIIFLIYMFWYIFIFHKNKFCQSYIYLPIIYTHDHKSK